MTRPPVPPPTAGGAARGNPVPPAQRGRIKLSDRVYTRVAAQAARHALADAWAERGEHGPLPTASVLVVRGGARLTLHLELPFPGDVPALARTVRDAVVDRVAALTGTPVADIAITVDRLVPLR